jgi:hypothetical protein
MLSMLQKEFNTLHNNGGKPPKLTAEEEAVYYLKIVTGVPEDGQYCSGIGCL